MQLSSTSSCRCGPVGAFAALLLSHYGLSVLCVEAEENAYSVPRAISIDDEIVRLLGLCSASLAEWMDEHVYKAPIDIRTGTYSPRYGDKSTLPGELRGWSIVGPDPPIAVGEQPHHRLPTRPIRRAHSLPHPSYRVQWWVR